MLAVFRNKIEQAGHRNIALHCGDAQTPRATGVSFTIVFYASNFEVNGVERVAARVTQGGHNIPEDVVRRLFAQGIRNFERYKTLVNSWQLYDNSDIPAVFLDES